MRVILAILTFCSVWSFGQEPLFRRAEQGCNSLTDAYYHLVLDRALQPPEWQTSLIAVSVAVAGSESKLVLREEGGNFELLRASPQEDIYAFLRKLEGTCQLPANPIDVAGRVKVNWEQKPVPAVRFDALHREFTSALSQNALEIQAQSATLLATHSAVLNLHVSQYVVVYENKSQRIEIRVDDTNSSNGKAGPLVAWVHSILKLSKETR